MLLLLLSNRALPGFNLLLQVLALLSKHHQSFCRLHSSVECSPVPDQTIDDVIQLPY